MQYMQVSIMYLMSLTQNGGVSALRGMIRKIPDTVTLRCITLHIIVTFYVFFNSIN